MGVLSALMPWGLGSWIHRQKPSRPQEALLLSQINQHCCTDGILSSHCRRWVGLERCSWWAQRRCWGLCHSLWVCLSLCP